MNTPPGWSGRIDERDGDAGLRWHQVVRAFDAHERGGVVLIGFAGDEGVRRNQGRAGAAAGPAAFRQAAGALPAWPGLQLRDAGDIACADGDLDSAQQRYGDAVAQAIEARALPLGIGGGHEIAFGTYLGVAAQYPSGTLGVLNFDAHFDLRRDVRATSGTPFLQMLDRGGERVRYRVLGISETANTRALFDTARGRGAHFVLDEALALTELDRQLELLRVWLANIDHLYLTVCLDVLPAPVAPGVSAPATRGVGLDVLEPLLTAAAGCGKLVAADIAELNPDFDLDQRTARVAARLAWKIARTAALRATPA
jgi:formiminoglutamase